MSQSPGGLAPLEQAGYEPALTGEQGESQHPGSQESESEDSQPADSQPPATQAQSPPQLNFEEPPPATEFLQATGSQGQALRETYRVASALPKQLQQDLESMIDEERSMAPTPRTATDDVPPEPCNTAMRAGAIVVDEEEEVIPVLAPAGCWRLKS